ncbi:MAG: ExeM/NucH family extracellular endonuclease, partial [Chloroflexota bacterium]
MNKSLSKMFSIITILALMVVALPVQSAGAISSDVVISQVYGGGGNTGAPYTNDFIELFNRGTSSVSLAGWSVQYTSATGTGNFGATTTQLTELPNASLAPGQYFLIQEAAGTTPSASLPTPDVIDATPIAMAAGAGKVALVNSTASLGCNGGSTPCSAAQLAMIIDLVGYGSANFFEGAAAPTLSNTTSASRAGSGCTDTDNNSTDFAADAPAPRNTSSPLNPCPVVTVPDLTINDVSASEGNSGTTSFDFTVSLSVPAGAGGVTFDIATADNTATVADNDYAVNALTGQTIPAGSSSYNFSVLANGDSAIEPDETFFVNVTNVTGAALVDGQGQGTILNDDATPPPPGGNVVISQVYGGGGNSGATYKNDFIELYNRSASAVDLTGWSVQYASSTGTAWQVTTLAGTIQPGSYYLIQEAAGTGGTVDLPTPNAIGSIPMSGTNGKVALVNNSTAFTVSCPSASSVDFVGYGTANCSETSPTAALTNTTAALRKSDGAQDTDNNSADFITGTPNPRNTPPPAPNLTVNDVSANEGNSGTTSFDFTVSLTSPAGAGGVTFDIATAEGTATVADNDYTANSLTGQTIPAGTSSYNFSVLVNGDTTDEGADETFFVNVTNVTGAILVDGQGLGTIVNDDIDFCSQTFTPTYSIQGSGTSAAITGTVTTQGVVVGDFEGTAAASGFYIQDLSGDGNAATSDGIFVFTGNSNLASVGDVVRVTGFARERFNQTTLNGSNSNTDPVTNVVNCGSGSVTATDVSLPFASATSPEPYEGMLVRFPQSLVIAEYFNYGRFGEVVLALPLAGESRPFSGTAIDEPGAPANARTAANALSRITLDDAQSAQNPPALRHPNGAPFSLTNLFRGGDTVQNAVGVLGFDFSLYRIIPTGPADYVSVNPRPASPEAVGGTIRVAAMNTLNFFVTLDPSGGSLDNKCGPANSLECRGADDSGEFTRQRDKLLTALAGLDADVIGLNELENSTGVEPLASIVSGLPGYDYIDTGTIGTDAIKVGLIYRPAVVTPVGDYELLTTAVDPRFIDTRSRPSLAQTFEVNATGARFTVVVNHLKSKGSACTGDPDLLDGQGNCSQTRRAAAEALVDWLATDPTGSGDPDFLIVGDLNSYAMEDAIDEIKAGADDVAGTTDDFTNLISHFHGAYAYSYTFDGQAGYLDHALANSSMFSQVTGAAEWHINSDEPTVLDYDTTFKPDEQDALYEVNQYRTSDHDAVVIGLDLPEVIAPTVTIDQAAGQADPTGLSPINFEVVFSEPVSGFTDADVTLDGTAGATTAVVTGGPTTYNVAVSGMTANGTVIASIPANAAEDAAGND